MSKYVFIRPDDILKLLLHQQDGDSDVEESGGGTYFKSDNMERDNDVLINSDVQQYIFQVDDKIVDKRVYAVDPDNLDDIRYEMGNDNETIY